MKDRLTTGLALLAIPIALVAAVLIYQVDDTSFTAFALGAHALPLVALGGLGLARRARQRWARLALFAAWCPTLTLAFYAAVRPGGAPDFGLRDIAFTGVAAVSGLMIGALLIVLRSDRTARRLLLVAGAVVLGQALVFALAAREGPAILEHEYLPRMAPTRARQFRFAVWALTSGCAGLLAVLGAFESVPSHRAPLATAALLAWGISVAADLAWVHAVLDFGGARGWQMALALCIWWGTPVVCSTAGVLALDS